MDKADLQIIYNYYVSLENDFSATSRYIEPKDQENVYSFEFSKLLILSCTEIEAVLKILCKEKSGKEGGNIGEYKDTILKYFPKIVTAEVSIARWGRDIRPFKGWKKRPLKWWQAYGDVKHNTGDNLKKATYKNAVYALSALYVLILYLAKVCDINIDIKTSYISSNYVYRYVVDDPAKPLPDFK